MSNQSFEIFGTAHSWINVKDFFRKTKMELIDTIDLEKDGVSKDIFKPYLVEESQSAFNYMILKGRIDNLIFGLLRENEELMKDYDYVVPSHFSFYSGCFNVTFDCFKEV